LPAWRSPAPCSFREFITASSVKTILFKVITDDATRLAALQAGEVDFINLVPGQLIETVKKDAKLQIAPTLAAPFWLEFPGWEKPDNPFHNIKVREAVSLALDRKALSEAETAGLSPMISSWIPDDWPGYVKGTEPKFDLARAKQLMTEAGVPNGFEVEALTPLPPYFSLGERVITQLRQIGIRTKLVQMDRAAFLEKLSQGPDAFKGIILNISGNPGDAASRVRAFAICKGASSRTCVPEIDEKFAQYERSADAKERERLLTEIQNYINANLIFPPVYRLAFVNVQGPRIANKWEEIWGSIPQYVYIGPYEDIKLKE
jgi:peptide/nickel transport system substrate-binding protein